jgi:hypothetical protein
MENSRSASIAQPTRETSSYAFEHPRLQGWQARSAAEGCSVAKPGDTPCSDGGEAPIRSFLADFVDLNSATGQLNVGGSLEEMVSATIVLADEDEFEDERAEVRSSPLTAATTREVL